MLFYHILHKNSIGIETSRDYFQPPPQSFRKEMDNIYVHFRRVFVQFVVFLTKIWHTVQIFIFIVTAKCWREGCFWPPSFTPRSD